MTPSEPEDPSTSSDGHRPDGAMHRLREGRRTSRTERAASTRSAIASAVLALSAAGRPLTASAVVREAGVSRPTFYTHFADLDDVIVMIHEQALADVSAWQQEALEGPERWSEPDAQRESFRRFAEYVDEHRELYATIFDLPAGAEVRRRVSAVMADALRTRLEKVATPPEGIEPEVISSALGAAYMHILGLWVRGELDATVDDVMAHFTELMPPWLVDPEPSPTDQEHRGGLSPSDPPAR